MKRIGILSAFFAVAATAVAQTSTNAPAGRAMSLADCIQAALAHNFDVQFQRYNPQIWLYNLNLAYQNYDPSFNISGTHSYSVTPGSYNSSIGLNTPSSVLDANNFSSGISGGPLPWGLTYGLSGNVSETYGSGSGGQQDHSGANIGITLTQPLLKNFWIDSTRLAIKVDKNKLKSSEQGLRLTIISTVTAVATAYYELISAQENVQVEREALQLAQTQLDQDRQRLQIGTLAVLSVQQDESQVAGSQATLIAAQSALDTAQNTLKTLLTDDYFKWHDVNIQPSETLAAPLQSFDLQDSWNKGMAERPDLLQARLSVENQGIQLKYDRNQLFPELDLIGTYGFNAASKEFSGAFGQLNQGNSPSYTYGAQLKMPLGNVQARNTAKLDKVTLQQLLLTLKQLEQKVMVDIDNAVKTAQSDYQSVEATKQARIYAEIALDDEQKTYAVGKATTFEVLTYQNNLTAARLKEIQALAKYNEDLANLAASEGSTLEHYNISIEAK